MAVRYSRGFKRSRISLVVAVLVVALSLPFLAAWFAMIWLGVAHGFDARVPAFGFWTCFFLNWALCAPIQLATFRFNRD